MKGSSSSSGLIRMAACCFIILLALALPASSSKNNNNHNHKETKQPNEAHQKLKESPDRIIPSDCPPEDVNGFEVDDDEDFYFDEG